MNCCSLSTDPGINTGMRLGEICGLCWDQVNFQSRQIVVRRTMSSKGLQESTKTKRVRYVPMNHQVFSLLEKLSRQSKSDFVCLNEKGNHWNVDHSGRWFKEALDKAKVRKIRFHDLRHTYASQFMMNNGNIYDLQKILGHTDMKMTMKYAHLSPDHLLSASNVVSFSGGSVEDLPENDQNILALR
ncbi:MAG: site-specific integrase [Bdellovibrionales bacterium]|nr:site-specific integrase [Bdellovibrionales bacterium]